MIDFSLPVYFVQVGQQDILAGSTDGKAVCVFTDADAAVGYATQRGYKFKLLPFETPSNLAAQLRQATSEGVEFIIFNPTEPSGIMHTENISYVLEVLGTWGSGS